MASKYPSPTERSLAYLREQGYLVTIVEHWNSHARVRQDLFGIIDLLAVKEGETLGVQCTDATNVSKRIKKIADHESTPALRAAGWAIHVHGWKPNNDQPRVVDLS